MEEKRNNIFECENKKYIGQKYQGISRPQKEKKAYLNK